MPSDLWPEFERGLREHVATMNEPSDFLEHVAITCPNCDACYLIYSDDVHDATLCPFCGYDLDDEELEGEDELV